MEISQSDSVNNNLNLYGMFELIPKEKTKNLNLQKETLDILGLNKNKIQENSTDNIVKDDLQKYIKDMKNITDDNNIDDLISRNQRLLEEAEEENSKDNLTGDNNYNNIINSIKKELEDKNSDEENNNSHSKSSKSSNSYKSSKSSSSSEKNKKNKTFHSKNSSKNIKHSYVSKKHNNIIIDNGLNSSATSIKSKKNFNTDLDSISDGGEFMKENTKNSTDNANKSYIYSINNYQEKLKKIQLIDEIAELTNIIKDNGFEFSSFGKLSVDTNLEVLEKIYLKCYNKYNQIKQVDFFKILINATTTGVEKVFNGDREFFGIKPNLKGIGDSIKSKIQRDKIQINKMANKVSETVGLNDTSKFLCEFLMLSFVQHNINQSIPSSNSSPVYNRI